MQCFKIYFSLLSAIMGLSCLGHSTSPTEQVEEPKEFLVIPLGLPPIPWPSDNPYSTKKDQLGRFLYFDKRLSSDNSISCASCHSIPKGFTDHNRVSLGIFGHPGTRHAPSVINSAYRKLLFWDGRAATLEDQCKGPISNPNEMTSANDPKEAYEQCATKIRNIEGYRILFKETFGNDDCSIDQIAQAIATFERTILSGNSPYDRYRKGDKLAMSAEQIKGYKIFNQVGCAICHNGPNFSNERFLNIGIGMDVPNPDTGRYAITGNSKDWGAFKVPTLRDVEYTYPYMHDGSLNTLEDVIEYYNRGGIPNANLHPAMKPLNLTEDDKKALVSFLKALSGEGWQHFKEPDEFPQ